MSGTMNTGRLSSHPGAPFVWPVGPNVFLTDAERAWPAQVGETQRENHYFRFMQYEDGQWAARAPDADMVRRALFWLDRAGYSHPSLTGLVACIDAGLLIMFFQVRIEQGVPVGTKAYCALDYGNRPLSSHMDPKTLTPFLSLYPPAANSLDVVEGAELLALYWGKEGPSSWELYDREGAPRPPLPRKDIHEELRLAGKSCTQFSVSDSGERTWYYTDPRAPTPIPFMMEKLKTWSYDFDNETEAKIWVAHEQGAVWGDIIFRQFPDCALQAFVCLIWPIPGHGIVFPL